MKLLVFFGLLAINLLDLVFGACPRIYTRAEWKARAPKSVSYLSNPVSWTIIHHSASVGCSSFATCAKFVKDFQAQHMDTNLWDDIGYSFLIGGDGSVYEGRGWSRVGSHTPNYNSNGLGFCLIGDFTSKAPATVQLEAVKSLIACGVEKKMISAQYKLIGHRQAKATECPGQALYNIITKWPPCPRIYSRAEWGARPPNGVSYLSNPVPWTIIHHAASASCSSFDTCAKLVRDFQNQHIDVNGWNDIGYSFVIGGDGSIFEGRGWDKVGAHTPGYNSNGLGFCFIGNYVSNTPPDAQLNAAQDLIACGVDLGMIASNYNLIGHRQAVATECPGQRLYDIIKALLTLPRPPNGVSYLNNPVDWTVIHHAESAACSTFDSCAEMVRQFQNFHMDENGWNDIGYSFVIGGEGSVFEGRGWDKVGAHTPGYNSIGLGFCFIGNFFSVEPTQVQQNAVQELISCGVELGMISGDYNLIGHRQAVDTDCPGDALYDIITSWPHWVNVLRLE
ncbi:unnamed protein product [Notodromas monacha]|uniref:Uncharacterized protein n=1 Tax=Notodromas monacha TaxID=399045 RepID=A0A7R9BGA9_9CRUS|nr:unnamed protein product [Notodromas monacha]CAG0913904.1 unnamed protein product [Notodromas monacha]